MNREKLTEKLKAITRDFETVNVPEFGEFCCRSLTLREKSENDLIVIGKKGDVDLTKMVQQKCDMLCQCVVDSDTKEPIFSRDDWELWADAPPSLTEPLLRACESINNIDSKETVAAGNLNETGD
jgi:hypothetical protein